LEVAGEERRVFANVTDLADYLRSRLAASQNPDRRR
jgi:hypothetical protein